MATGELEEGREGGGGKTAGPFSPIPPPPPRRPDDPRRPFKRYQLKTDPGSAQLEERAYIFPTPPSLPAPYPIPISLLSGCRLEPPAPSRDLSLPPPEVQLINSNNEQQAMIM